MTDPNRRWLFYDSFSKTQSNPVSTEDAQLAILKMSEKDTERFFIWTAGWEKWQPLKAYLSSKQKIFFSSLQAAMEQHMPESTYSNSKTITKTMKAKEREVLEMKPADKHVQDEVTKSSFNTAITKTSNYSRISLDEADIEDDSAKSGRFDGDELTLSRMIQKPKINFKSLNAKNLRERPDRHELKIEVLLISSKGKTFRSTSQNISLTGSLLENNIPFEYSGSLFDAVVINTLTTDRKFERVTLKAKTVGEGLTQRIQFVNMTAENKKSLQSLLEHYLNAKENQKKQVA